MLFDVVNKPLLLRWLEQSRFGVEDGVGKKTVVEVQFSGRRGRLESEGAHAGLNDERPVNWHPIGESRERFQGTAGLLRCAGSMMCRNNVNEADGAK